MWNDALVFIDFPQAVDPQEGPDAALLQRHHQSHRLVCPQGVDVDPDTVYATMPEVFR
jgi:serine/threonine-protein kinase RIO1